MPPETIQLLSRYEIILISHYTPNPYFKTEFEYKQEIRDKMKEIKILNGGGKTTYPKELR